MDDVQGCLREARAHVRAGRLGEAQRLVERALHLAPAHAQARQILEAIRVLREWSEEPDRMNQTMLAGSAPSVATRPATLAMPVGTEQPQRGNETMLAGSAPMTTRPTTLAMPVGPPVLAETVAAAPSLQMPRGLPALAETVAAPARLQETQVAASAADDGGWNALFTTSASYAARSPLEVAHERLRQGDALGALSAALDAMHRGVSVGEASGFLKQHAPALEQACEQALGGWWRVAELVMPRAQVDALPLGGPTRMVASLVDGQRSVAALVEATRWPRVQVAHAVLTLIRNGAVRMRPG